jgi:hypothetical protein
MRFEGQHGGRRAHRGGARREPGQHGLVAQVHAVEIADGDGIGAGGLIRAVVSNQPWVIRMM